MLIARPIRLIKVIIQFVIVNTYIIKLVSSRKFTFVSLSVKVNGKTWKAMPTNEKTLSRVGWLLFSFWIQILV
jgi:hypothetical protein